MAAPADCRPSKGARVDEILEVLKTQADAWNRGDLDAFMTAYLHSDKTSYISGDTEIYGYEALKQRYEKRYGIRSSTMGRLTFTDPKITPLSKESALCIGHWQVAVPGKPEVHGIFSLVLVLSGGEWKILHDHTTAL